MTDYVSQLNGIKKNINKCQGDSSLPGDKSARGQVPGRNLVQVSCHRWHRQAKRLGEDRFFSGAFGVFTAFQFFSCVLFGGIGFFRIFADG